VLVVDEGYHLRALGGVLELSLSGGHTDESRPIAAHYIQQYMFHNVRSNKRF
jgi:hypothetical protein